MIDAGLLGIFIALAHMWAYMMLSEIYRRITEASKSVEKPSEDKILYCNIGEGGYVRELDANERATAGY